jgi:hypothetical protein
MPINPPLKLPSQKMHIHWEKMKNAAITPDSYGHFPLKLWIYLNLMSTLKNEGNQTTFF